MGVYTTEVGFTLRKRDHRDCPKGVELFDLHPCNSDAREWARNHCCLALTIDQATRLKELARSSGFNIKHL